MPEGFDGVKEGGEKILNFAPHVVYLHETRFKKRDEQQITNGSGSNSIEIDFCS